MKSRTKHKIVLIIPAYNEEKTLRKVLDEARHYCDDMIVINDGSTDCTAEIAKKAGAKVSNNPINMGLGKTIRRGYELALETDADIVVQTDADGQYTLSDIPKLVKPIIDDKADIVLASRTMGGIESMPLGKRMGNWFGTKVTKMVSGYPVSDAQTGFRAMRRELLESILPTSKYTYVQEMIIRPAKEGWRIAEIPSFFKRRDDGSSRLISGLSNYASKAVLIILRTIVDYHALKFFALPGVVLLLVGIGFGIDVMYYYFQFLSTGIAINKVPSTILATLFITSGIVLIFMGILADIVTTRFREMQVELRSLRFHIRKR